MRARSGGSIGAGDESFEDLLSESIAVFVSGRPLAAMRLAINIISERPDNIELLKCFADLYMLQETSAINQYKYQARANRDPRICYDVATILGRVALEEQDQTKQANILRHAEGNFRMAIRIDGQYAEAYSSLACLYHYRKLYGTALTHHDQASNLRRDDPQFIFRKGQTLLATGNYVQAMRYYAFVVDADISDSIKAKAHNQLGLIYKKRLESPELSLAVSAFESAIELDPRNPSYHFNLAKAYKKSGLDGEAVISFANAINCGREDPKIVDRAARNIARFENYTQLLPVDFQNRRSILAHAANSCFLPSSLSK